MSNEQPTVLIVEDEEDLTDLYAGYLADTGTIRRANSGEKARGRCPRRSMSCSSIDDSPI